MLASVVYIAIIVNMSAETKTKRSTYTLPSALAPDVLKLAADMGVSQQDLLTQGVVRVLNEWRSNGSLQLLPLKPKAA